MKWKKPVKHISLAFCDSSNQKIILKSWQKYYVVDQIESNWMKHKINVSWKRYMERSQARNSSSNNIFYVLSLLQSVLSNLRMVG